MTEHADRITERDRPVISEEMIQAGVIALEDAAGAASLAEAAESVYIAMVRQRDTEESE